MEKMTWGLLGPEKLANTRRARTLGLGAAVRAFNELAVPGLGGVWFGKQLLLPTLGVVLAERARQAGNRVQNIEMANAVEALACSLALNQASRQSSHSSQGNAPDPRLRGSTKLRGKTDLRFAVVRKPGFYVTQPMRMATVQTLPALGLMAPEGARFNAFTCTADGRALLDAATDAGVLTKLGQWVTGKDCANHPKICSALSPLQELPQAARDILQERLLQGHLQEDASNRARRRAALAWVELLRQTRGANMRADWRIQPNLLDETHWHDLQAGALFFALRDAAIAVLDQVEISMSRQTTPALSLLAPLAPAVAGSIDSLREKARAWLQLDHQQADARAFCTECLQDSDPFVLASLVSRDERVLRRVGDAVLPGPAFRHVEARLANDAQAAEPTALLVDQRTISWPPGISGRIRNLFLLNADLQGDLANWLGSAQISPNGEDE